MARSRILFAAVAVMGLALTTSACGSSTSSAPAASASVQAKGNADVFLDDQFPVQADCNLDANAQQLYFSAELTCPDLVMSNRYVLFQPEGPLDLTGAKLTSARVAFAGGVADINLHGADLRRATLTAGEIGSGSLDLTGANLSDTNLKTLDGTVLTDETTVLCHTVMPKTGKVNDRDC